MAEFLTAHKATAQIEGGYANDPDDNGGETFAGIARQSFPAWKGWPAIDAYKKQFGGRNADAINKAAATDSDLQQQVLNFYKSNFWDVLQLDAINDQRTANELYDTGVNMGTGRAALFFQRVLNACNRNGNAFQDLALDGSIGVRTIVAFNNLSLQDKYMVWKLLNCLQGAKYIDICEHNPTQKKFMRSWASRVFETVI